MTDILTCVVTVKGKDGEDFVFIVDKSEATTLLANMVHQLEEGTLIDVNIAYVKFSDQQLREFLDSMGVPGDVHVTSIQIDRGILN